MGQLIAADVGGTKTIIGLFSEEDGPRRPIVVERFESDAFRSLRELVGSFINETGAHPVMASFGIAGPVDGEVVTVTNLPWRVDADRLRDFTSSGRVALINDLAAMASGIPVLEASDLVQIKPGQPREKAPIAIIAPGTGLGEGFLFWDGRRYRPIPSEGGHTDFGPSSDLEMALLAYLRPRLGHVSYERVCSGIGIPNLFAFLKDSGKYAVPDWLETQLREAEDATPIIVESGQAGTSDICVATLHLFLSILGGEAGNLVLQALTRGGVYLGGGIPPRIIPELSSGPFIEAFLDKGRFRSLMEETPIFVIINRNAGLYGAANHGLLQMRRRR